MTAHVHEDAFREIQLNGKQLVFMFMVATVASVVIFLSGVFVGRGVRAERSGSEEAAALVEAPAADDAPAKNSTGSALAQDADPRVVAPPPTVDDQSYVARLEKRNAPVEELKPAAAPPATPPARSAATSAGKPVQAPPTPRPAPQMADSSAAAKPSDKNVAVAAPAPPAAVSSASTSTSAASAAAPSASPAAAAASGHGFVVQVAALNVRSEADAIAKRLVAKGYAAFVQTPSNGTPAVFRVRIGPVSTRQEADTLAAKLQKEEQFKPWVTR